MEYIIAHDLGTSGNKASLYTVGGQLVKSITYGYDTHFFNNNWAEQDANKWWQAVCITTKELIKDIQRHLVIGVSFSAQMQGCVCVDGEGNILRPAIIWADQRATKENNQILSHITMQDFYQITGHRASPSYSIQKLMWIKENEKEIYNKTYKMLNCKDYMILKLTGNFVTDYSDASGTNALDINKKYWSEEILTYAGVDKEKLPQILGSTEVAGFITRQASQDVGLLKGTPIVVGAGDGVCATVGASCVREGDTYSCVGSSAWIATTSKKPIYDKEMKTFNFVHMIPEFIVPCGTMQTGGGAYSWAKTRLGAYEELKAKELDINFYELMNEKIGQSPIGANGLIFLPYLLGERSPRWNPDARGAFIGLKMEHQREDLFRAVLEGIAFNLEIILKSFKEQAQINEMKIIGGGAKSDVWTQIMADMYGLPILKPKLLEEATGMGAAVAAGVGVGAFDNLEMASKFFDIEKSIQPNGEHMEFYNKMKPIFDESYYSLLKVYEQLANL